MTAALPNPGAPITPTPVRGKRFKPLGMVVVGLSGVAAISGIIYTAVLASAPPDRTTEQRQRQSKVDPAGDSMDFLNPPAAKAAEADISDKEEKITDGEEQPADKRQTIEQKAYLEYKEKALQQYYGTKLAMEKKRVDDLERGRDSMWKRKQDNSADQVADAVSPTSDIIGAEKIPAGLRTAGAGGSTEEVLNSYRRAPASRYMISASNYIPMRTRGGITSAGKAPVFAKVTRDVMCDTPDGLRAGVPCIPAGTDIQLSYDTQITRGTCRLTMTADRAIFEDRTSMSLGKMPTADVSGAAGLDGKCDTHLWERLLSAALFSVADSAGAMATAALGGSLVNINPIGGVAEKEAQSGMQVPVTMTVPANVEFNMAVSRDLLFTGPYVAYRSK